MAAIGYVARNDAGSVTRGEISSGETMTPIRAGGGREISLNLRQKQAIEIRPGTQAQVELHTGGKTVLQYLLKPLYKSQEAFREP